MKTLELVVKIGSMALIQKSENAIDYNIFQRLGADLRPGMILVTSGATEIGRLDYLQRTGHELTGVTEQDKVDYSAQGQTILMNAYRQFIRPEYGIRQVLVEHTHFNDPQRREHIHRLLQRAAEQDVIPIINYNDPVSDEDETAEVVAQLVGAKTLILLTSTEGIYLNRDDPSTLVKLVSGETIEEVRAQVTELMSHCSGASRSGANGARAKLAYALRAVEHGTSVIIGHARHHMDDLLSGRVPCTRLGVGLDRKG